MNINQNNTVSREGTFVASLIEGCKQDKGLAARLRRADNPATEYQSWDFLARFGIQLDNSRQRLPYALVVASVARAKAIQNGTLTLGKAIALCYDDGNINTQAIAKLRRILACNDLPTLCRVLRPVFTLIDSRVTDTLDYVKLLQQLRQFSFEPDRVKTQWAQEFYS